MFKGKHETTVTEFRVSKTLKRFTPQLVVDIKAIEEKRIRYNQAKTM